MTSKLLFSLRLFFALSVLLLSSHCLLEEAFADSVASEHACPIEGEHHEQQKKCESRPGLFYKEKASDSQNLHILSQVIFLSVLSWESSFTEFSKTQSTQLHSLEYLSTPPGETAKQLLLAPNAPPAQTIA